MKIPKPTRKLVSKIKRIINASQKRKKDPDPIIRYRARIEYDCASQILEFVQSTLIEPQKVTKQAPNLTERSSVTN